MTIREIELAIRSLSPEELAAFREWFVEFETEEWDREFEQDVATGRLDRIADNAKGQSLRVT